MTQKERIDVLEKRITELENASNNLLDSLKAIVHTVNENAEVTNNQFKAISNHMNKMSRIFKEIADKE